MKKLISLTLMLLMGLAASAALADTAELRENDSFYYNVYSPGNYVALVEYHGDDTELILPSELDGLPVTFVGTLLDYYRYNTQVTRIVVPESVTELGYGAFCNFEALEEIVLPQGLTAIPYDAFRNCASLEHIEIPEGVTKIDLRAFQNCASLREVTLPDATVYLYDDAFAHCHALESVHLSPKLEFVANNAFEDCPLLREIDLPDTVKSIGFSAFSGCTALERVSLPSALTEIGGCAFKDCVSLTQVDLPGSLVHDLNAVFEGSGVKEITLPEQVTYVSMGDPLTVHGGKLAYRVNLGESLAFNLYRDEGYAVLAKYDGRASEIDVAVIPAEIDGLPVTEIGSRVFYGMPLVKLVVPEGVVKIGDGALLDCFRLAHVELPSTLEVIGSEAFAGCKALTEVTLPAGCVNVAEDAFDPATAVMRP